VGPGGVRAELADLDLQYEYGMDRIEVTTKQPKKHGMTSDCDVLGSELIRELMIK
jgi:hypothetical protein